MSVSTIEIILGRIKTSTICSPILVLSSKESGKLKAVFAGTVWSRKLVKNKDKSIVGVFNRDMDQERIKRILKKAAKAVL